MSNSSLFNTGAFELSSGESSFFKIDCDALTDNDILSLAEMFVRNIVNSNNARYRMIIPVPGGGLRFAEAISSFLSPEPHDTDLPYLLVDDVWTTGQTMMKYKQKIEHYGGSVEGVVIFSRDPHITSESPWVMPMFVMDLVNIT